ncbi:Mu transposase C-terminal domain-containing protein [Shewanella xiamenensis]|nr:Mu transposase C-terminal domain-containing protein [Shewanella xiamenensis]MDV5246968.1 Mu transposase C-terminal domain-containing protein [Shewanella xiamenensis]
MLMGITDERTLTRNGFKYQELMYDSTALADYRKRYPQTKESIKKLIKVDPDDLSYIHVYLEELGGYIKVPCTDNSNYTNGLSLHEHKVIKQVNREIIREGKDNLGLAKARMAIHARVKQEQEAFQISNKKAKISGVKMQAQLADVSNTGQGTIRLESEELFPSLPKKSESNISNLLEHWDDDLEAFE